MIHNYNTIDSQSANLSLCCLNNYLFIFAVPKPIIRYLQTALYPNLGIYLSIGKLTGTKNELIRSLYFIEPFLTVCSDKKFELWRCGIKINVLFFRRLIFMICGD